MNFSNITYVPQAKWKAGERAAIASLDSDLSERILPVFRLVPPGSFDVDTQTTVTPEEYLRNFGSQLSDCRGRLPTLLDGELIAEIISSQTGRLLYAELLERGRIWGANPIPLISPNSLPQYLTAVRSFIAHSGQKNVCLRIGLGELESIPDSSVLFTILESVGAEAENSVLLIDGGPIAVDNPMDLAQLLATNISRIVKAGDWGLVSWSCTTFPEKPKIGAGQSAAFDRGDWALYCSMKEISDEFSVLPVYSDYLLEYPSHYKPLKIPPTAQLRYSTENRYFIFKGLSVNKGSGYANIFDVADQLKSSGIFKGRAYSLGDSFIADLADRKSTPGHASKWRWSSTDHHLLLVLNQLGVPTIVPQIAATPGVVQLRLV